MKPLRILDLANEMTPGPAIETTPVLQMKSHRIWSMRRHTGLANEIAQNPTNAISQRVANETTQNRVANEIPQDPGPCK